MDYQKKKMKKKPIFKRQQFMLKKLKEKWRKPKGLHSKLRLQKRGKWKRPRIGYGSKLEERGLIKGQKPTHIKNLKDLENLKGSIIISSKVGLRKKLEIINKSRELKLEIINIKDVNKFLEEVKKKQEEKSQKKKLRKEKKSKKIEKAKKEESKDKVEKEEDKGKKIKEEKKKILEKGL